MIVGPISIKKTDRDGRTTEQIQATYTGTVANLATATISQSDYTAWTTYQYQNTRLVGMRVYDDIPSSGTGTSGTNYDQTTYAYETYGSSKKGRQNKTVAPDGTITRVVLDARGNVLETWIGTNDTGATDADPSHGGSPNNMLKVASSTYDADGNLLTSTQYVGGIPNGGTSQFVSSDTVTSYGYDWRDWLLWSYQNDGTYGTYSYNTYDNLGDVTEVDRYWDDDADFATAHAEPWNGTTPGDDQILARSTISYDALGEVYQTATYAVDPTDSTAGAVGDALVSKYWYDAAGEMVKSQASGSQAFAKYKYDGLGRPTEQYVGYDPTGETTANLYDSNGDVQLDLGDDAIFQQTATSYDAAGEAILVTNWQRKDTETGTGELTTSSALASYFATWYDVIGRVIATANYGTQLPVGGRPDAAPAVTSTDALVTHTAYVYVDANGDGHLEFVVETSTPTTSDTVRTDWSIYDAAGRVVENVQNAVDDNSDGLPDAPTTGNPDHNVTVLTTYTPDGQLATYTAVNPTTGNQTTHYVYGTTLSDSGVARNDLLRAVIYPDSDDPTDLSGSGSDGIYDRVEYRYNKQGQQVEVKDQNQTVHDYLFDAVGRQTEDLVSLPTSNPQNIDDSVLRIDRAYEVRGMIEEITSYSNTGGTNVVNQVLDEYNDWGLLSQEYQEHSGATNGSTPSVQYGYDLSSSGGVITKGLRPTGITYPNGTALGYGYNSGYDDALNRVSYLAEGGSHVAEYTYLGLSQILGVKYPGAGTSGTTYDLNHQTSGVYDYLDQFGRVKDAVWAQQGSSTALVSLAYGYDAAGNLIYRQDVVAGSANNLDEVYAYDSLNQLQTMQRGHWDNGNPNTGTFVADTSGLSQSWGLDATGNMSSVTTNGTTQTRTQDAANETTAASGWATPVYDRVGNMTTTPAPLSGNLTHSLGCKYDAWNHLTQVTDGATVYTYKYDGLSRRIEKIVPGEIRHFYLSGQNQVLEERVGTSTNADRQNVWGLRYVDDLSIAGPRHGCERFLGRAAIRAARRQLECGGDCWHQWRGCRALHLHGLRQVRDSPAQL